MVIFLFGYHQQLIITFIYFRFIINDIHNLFGLFSLDDIIDYNLDKFIHIFNIQECHLTQNKKEAITVCDINKLH